MMWREIADAGKRMVETRLTHSTMGNISVRLDSEMLITCRGADLGRLREKDVTRIPIEGTGGDPRASVEAPVHRRIYRMTDARTVIHGHPPHAVALSLAMPGPITPADAEGRLYLREIPVVDGTPGSDSLAKKVALALQQHPAVIVKGHGTFTTGAALNDALNIHLLSEHSCRVIWLIETLRR